MTRTANAARTSSLVMRFKGFLPPRRGDDGRVLELDCGHSRAQKRHHWGRDGNLTLDGFIRRRGSHPDATRRNGLTAAPPISNPAEQGRPSHWHIRVISRPLRGVSSDVRARACLHEPLAPAPLVLRCKHAPSSTSPACASVQECRLTMRARPQVVRARRHLRFSQVRLLRSRDAPRQTTAYGWKHR